MLLGTPQSGGVDWNANDFVYFPTWAIYAQDDWKATRRLTFNLGIRYDVNVGAKARQNGLNRGMCLTCVNPTTNNPTYQANLAMAAGALAAAGIDPASLSTVYGGIQFAGENGQPSNAYDTDFSNVAPRIGFAYEINPKTVIRGGYGLMYSIGLENGTHH
jgi:outer membrane receptor protein involved in Fe transport